MQLTENGASRKKSGSVLTVTDDKFCVFGVFAARSGLQRTKQVGNNEQQVNTSDAQNKRRKLVKGNLLEGKTVNISVYK